ncbi:unnamed protein product [Cuscuta campestris]|uniref:Zinc finger PHD-type domain-containing protein n=1 Tax=Cuscuta campestris TaxID=132261 RepID=A0A484MD77_9ASTE|nr:unnamed protein product [Cuscuta campestris]
MGGMHMLKWDIQSFVAHKRSTLPQCDLLQLKDMIINSSDPHLSILKERSGLLPPNQSGNASNGTIGHMHGEQNFKPLVENGNPVACSQDNENKTREILHDRDLIPAKKRKCASVDNQGRKSSEERILLDDNCDIPCASRVTKKCKRSAGSDKDCEHTTDCIEDEGCNLENVSQAGGLEGSGSDAALKDITNAELRNSNHEKLSLVREISHANETERKSHHNLLNGGPTNEAKVGVDGFHELELCSDTDEYHEERIDIASKKTMFLSSQCTHSQDSLLTTDLSEINLCMKCNRGGELLVCSSEACPLVVHDGCLGSPPSFEKDGKFYCPFCAYCRAISEYMELKKKASLARKDLASFIGVRIEPPRNFPTRPIGSKTSQSMQDEELCGKGEAKSSRISLNEANSPQCRANTEEKQQQQTVSSAGDGPPSEYKMISSTNASPVTLEKDSSNGDDYQHHNETLAITVYNMHGLPHGDPRSSNQNEPSCEVEVEKENMPQRVISLHHQPELTSGTDDVEESSDEEKGKSQASKYFIRFYNPEKQ